MDRRYELQKHDRKEREYKKDERKQHEQWQEEGPRTSHRTWYAIIGVILFAITGVTVIASVVMLWTKTS
jgi:hypothetical protein